MVTGLLICSSVFILLYIITVQTVFICLLLIKQLVAVKNSLYLANLHVSNAINRYCMPIKR